MDKEKFLNQNAEPTGTPEVATPVAATEAIAFSNGVTFTPEELSQLDPVLREKLSTVKAGYSNLQTSFQEVNSKVKTLAEKKVEVVKPAEQPKTAPVAAQTDDEFLKQWQFKQITEQRFNVAYNQAKANYGEVALEKMGPSIATELKASVEQGKYDTDFASIFAKGFNQLMISDVEFVKAYTAYKTGTSAEEAAVAAATQAKAELLKSATNVTTGIPVGVAPLGAPTEKFENQRVSLTNSRERALELIKKSKAE